MEVLQVLKVESQFLFSFYDKDSLVHLVKSTLVNIDVMSQSKELVNYREDVADIYAHFSLSLMDLQPEEEELISEQAQTWLEAFTGSLHSLEIREFYIHETLRSLSQGEKTARGDAEPRKDVEKCGKPDQVRCQYMHRKVCQVSVLPAVSGGSDDISGHVDYWGSPCDFRHSDWGTSETGSPLKRLTYVCTYVVAIVCTR